MLRKSDIQRSRIVHNVVSHQIMKISNKMVVRADLRYLAGHFEACSTDLQQKVLQPKGWIETLNIVEIPGSRATLNCAVPKVPGRHSMTPASQYYSRVERMQPTAPGRMEKITLCSLRTNTKGVDWG